ncbi:MAG TPA: prolyl oligopeptidase family serine peptidase [Gaiellaceae bacterium]|nr:prolyl oligopeptidase family serine peptidase [Gaiellaceae bacterium]
MAPQLEKPRSRPYGTWSSPISAEVVARAGTSLGLPWLENGVAWWLEGRPAENGRVVLMRAGPGEEPVDVTTPGFNVRSAVHEYGGGAYCIHRDVVFFSNFDDQRLYRQDPSGRPTPLTPEVAEKRHRYADGRMTPDGMLWLGVRERHAESGRPHDVVNELVAVAADGSAEPRVLAGGRDFYSTPRISPDGTRLAFLAWNLPWMPWDGCELFTAELAPDGTLGELTHVAGRDGEESIWQPEWSPDGDLVYASDRSGWWNLERIRDGERSVLHVAEAEFGYPAWTFGGRSFAFLGDRRIACAYDQAGRTHFAVLDPRNGVLEPLDVPYDALRGTPYLTAEGTSVLLIAGSSTDPNQVARVDVASGEIEVLHKSAQVPVDEAFFSKPEAVEFPTEGDLTAHALFYAPTNPKLVAPEHERPPLIVMSHGGPTGNATPLFDLGIQFWTTRGFAVVDVNYGGSTGFGRSYRERLNGQWGVVDLRDCVNAGIFLAERGDADPDRLLITGGSAGGYTTICALTFTNEFAAGTTYFGIADLDQFAGGDTHKFELQYEHTLVGPHPEAAHLYRERSPIHFCDRIETPMLVLQGADDKIVPPSQAELIVGALRERRIPHAYLLFEGEGHGFRKAENIVRSLEAELSFYLQILGVEPGDPIPTLEIENFAA